MTYLLSFIYEGEHTPMAVSESVSKLMDEAALDVMRTDEDMIITFTEAPGDRWVASPRWGGEYLIEEVRVV